MLKFPCRTLWRTFAVWFSSRYLQAMLRHWEDSFGRSIHIRMLATNYDDQHVLATELAHNMYSRKLSLKGSHN